MSFKERSPWLLIGIAFIILGGLLVVINLLYPSWLSVISTIVSLLLSALLVLLYYQQRRLLEAQHTPLILPIDYEFPQSPSEGGQRSYPNQDKIEFLLANKGNGNAKCIKVRCSINPRWNDNSIQTEDSTIHVTDGKLRLEPYSNDLRQSDGGGKLRPEATLQVDEQEWFETDVQVLKTNVNDSTSPIGQSIQFRESMAILSDIGVNAVHFELYLEYEDMVNNEFSKRLIDGVVEPQEELTLYEAFQEGGTSSVITIAGPKWYQVLNPLSDHFSPLSIIDAIRS